MGNLVKETPYSEITATLEVLDRWGVKRKDLTHFRKAPTHVQWEVAKLIRFGENWEKETGGELIREESIKRIQCRCLIDLGFHKALGISENEFINIVPLPKEGKTGHILVVSQKYVSPRTSISLIEVGGKHGKNSLNLDLLEDVKEANAPQGMFYWRYDLDNGKNYCGKSPKECLRLIRKANRIPGTANESIYVVAQKPEILPDHYLDCPGSRYNCDSVPCLRLRDGKPELDWDYTAGGYSRCGSFSFGE